MRTEQYTVNLRDMRQGGDAFADKGISRRASYTGSRQYGPTPPNNALVSSLTRSRTHPSMGIPPPCSDMCACAAGRVGHQPLYVDVELETLNGVAPGPLIV